MKNKISFINSIQALQLDQLLVSKYNYTLDILVQHAGLAVKSAVKLIDQSVFSNKLKKISVLAGPGYNGGDGLVLSRLLKQDNKYDIKLTYFKAPQNPVLRRLHSLCEVFKVPLQSFRGKEELEQELEEAELIVDGIFGFSFKGEMRQPYKQVIQALSKYQKKILSIDIPSGWHSESGNQLGLFEPAYLVSLSLPKEGVRTFKGVHWLGGKFVNPSAWQELDVKGPSWEESQLIQLSEIEHT